eukprot:COSAG03_NODE_3878_length_1782_cov_1.637552_3_plen_61_part_01
MRNSSAGAAALVPDAELRHARVAAGGAQKPGRDLECIHALPKPCCMQSHGVASIGRMTPRV